MSEQPVAVFDIGGTSMRSALLDGDEVLLRRTRPSPSHLRLPGRSPEVLQDLLVTMVAQEARRLARHADVRLAGIGLGAAIDARSGVAIGSGPLWGPGDGMRFDLAAALAREAPDFDWSVANDVSANAVALAALPESRRFRRLVAVTVGSGIALRTIDVGTGRISTRRESGLQGEVGHLPAQFSLTGRERVLTCDCGAPGHLSAYASGNGIARLLAELAGDGAEWLRGGASETDQFSRALAAGHPPAGEILDAVTRPLAATLLSVLTIDADVDRIVLAGGVPFALGAPYLASLIGNMAAIGLYGSDATLAGHVVLADPDGDVGLRGAGLIARAAAGPSRASRRWVVPGDDPKAYDVVLARDVLDPHGPALRTAARLNRGGPQRRLVVCDARVWERYGARIEHALCAGPGQLTLEPVALDLDEAAKALPAVTAVVDAFDRFGLLRRSEPVLAFGGGVLLDVVGLAASLYRRGVPYVKVPTTLLAMVDAAIGVKTAVNYGGAKSRLGTYHRPSGVVIDPVFLRTLDVRQYRNGLAEAVKMALVADADLFDLIEMHACDLARGAPDEAVEWKLIEGSVTAMLAELTGNLTEGRLERLADFGHAFSGAIEMRLEPALLHGECVAVDMALTVLISQARGLLDRCAADRVIRVLTTLRLPIGDPAIDAGLLQVALDDTRRHRDGLQRIPLLREIGAAVFASDITDDEVRAALEELRAHAAGPVR